MDYDFVNNSGDSFFSKKNIVTYLILAIITLAIPVGVRMVQTQQAILKSRAAGTEVSFPDLRQNANGDYVSQSPNIKVQLTSPFGPPAPKSQTQ